MLSSVYQQSSEDNPKAEQVDPANQLLWRMNRGRLDFEAMRDTLLMLSGNIDWTAGGRAVEIVRHPDGAFADGHRNRTPSNRCRRDDSIRLGVDGGERIRWGEERPIAAP